MTHRDRLPLVALLLGLVLGYIFEKSLKATLGES